MGWGRAGKERSADFAGDAGLVALRHWSGGAGAGVGEEELCEDGILKMVLQAGPPAAQGR